MLKFDLCKENKDITHLMTIPLKLQQDRFGYINHVHICLDCVKELYPSGSLEEIKKVEEKIFQEVLINENIRN